MIRLMIAALAGGTVVSLVTSPRSGWRVGASTPAPTAREILLASADAIGGLDRLRSARGIRVEETGGEYLVSTVTRRDAPPKLISQSVVTHRSGGTGFRRTTEQSFPM